MRNIRAVACVHSTYTCSIVLLTCIKHDHKRVHYTLQMAMHHAVVYVQCA